MTNKIKKISADIPMIDAKLIEKTQKRLDNLTKPLGSLGRLEELARQAVGITGNEHPVFKNKVIFTLAADHGVTEEGISAFPKEVTAQMVYNFLNGGAGINVLAKHVGAKVIVVDMGVAQKIDCFVAPPLAGAPRNDTGVPYNFKNKKIALGTQNFAKGPAMTRENAIKSIEAGIALVEKELKNGLDIIGTGDMGIGNTTSASAITAAITGKEVKIITGKGTGITDSALTNKIKVIEKALKINKPNPKDALDVLTKVGGFEIGGLVGIILAAAANRIPIVIDGFISGSAALIAFGIEPKTKDYMIASHVSVEIGHKIILEHIGLNPIMNLNLRLGEGTGAALGISIVEAGVKILNEMATFQNAGVSNSCHCERTPKG
ncbi:MAG: nicotinate-nucleotide--dimethylbenzimidazole phosphoribosyltransferase [Candidatus Omnitrophota bacterium]